MKGKGKAVPRRSPRKKGKTCGRPFKAPRLIEETVNDSITVTETETNVSQVQIITETKTNDIQVPMMTEIEQTEQVTYHRSHQTEVAR